MNEIKYNVDQISDNIKNFNWIEQWLNALNYHLEYSLLELEKSTSPKVMDKLFQSVEYLKKEINMLHQNCIVVNNFLNDSIVIIKDLDKKNP